MKRRRGPSVGLGKAGKLRRPMPSKSRLAIGDGELDDKDRYKQPVLSKTMRRVKGLGFAHMARPSKGMPGNEEQDP